MRLRLLMTLAVALHVSMTSDASAGSIEELESQVRDLLKTHLPEAMVEIENGHLIAKYNTMTFTVHHRTRVGEFSSETYEIEAPNHTGFQLIVSQRDGVYDGPMETPQTLSSPYWQSFHDRPAFDDGKRHWNVILKFGSRFDQDLKSKLLKLLPSSTRPSD